MCNFNFSAKEEISVDILNVYLGTSKSAECSKISPHACVNYSFAEGINT